MVAVVVVVTVVFEVVVVAMKALWWLRSWVQWNLWVVAMDWRLLFVFAVGLRCCSIVVLWLVCVPDPFAVSKPCRSFSGS